MQSTRRVLLRYALFQIPDLILLGLALTVAVRWWELSNAVAYTLFGIWVVKDIAMFPVMRVAYANGGSHDRLTGASGVAREILDPGGYVRVGSELWKARVFPEREPVPAGTAIRVIELQGLELIVEPVDDPAAEPVEVPIG
jgi:membrane-bound ClpP family serine protease